MHSQFNSVQQERMHCWKYVLNQLLSADDGCMFAPSFSGLQCLLNICYNQAAELEIVKNVFNYKRNLV